MSSRKTIKPYKVLTDWKVGNSTQKEGDRTVVKLCLGECYQDDKRIYIVEDIYKDILEDVEKNRRDYQIIVNLGKKPQLIILMNGSLVMHNKEVLNIFLEVKNIIKTLDKDLVKRAMLELRLNKDNLSCLSATTEALVSKINSINNTQYPASFIYPIINGEYEEKNLSPDEETKEVLMFLEYKEILELMGAIDIYEATQKTENSILRDLMLNNSLEEIKEYMAHMVYHKLYTGYFTKRK